MSGHKFVHLVHCLPQRYSTLLLRPSPPTTGPPKLSTTLVLPCESYWRLTSLTLTQNLFHHKYHPPVRIRLKWSTSTSTSMTTLLSSPNHDRGWPPVGTPSSTRDTPVSCSILHFSHGTLLRPLCRPRVLRPQTRRQTSTPKTRHGPFHSQQYLTLVGLSRRSFGPGGVSCVGK